MLAHHHNAQETLAKLEAGQLAGSKQIKIAAGLKHFPEALYQLTDSLEILDLSGNNLSDLPKDLHRFKKLRILFCSSNRFTHIPEVLGQCQSLSMIGFKANQITHIPESAIPTKTLQWFIVTDNALTQVPSSLGQCKKLQKLMLAGNQLSQLPDSMADCHQLELLRIAANQFETLPDWLFDLPKLTWLAYAGNPFSNQIAQSIMAHHSVQPIEWADVRLGKVLGQGASGVSYQAHWISQNKAVAVKLFKSGITSDGLPTSEMQANMIAGQHQNLVGILGEICHHPDGVQGIVMPLLSDDLNSLAQPPSFDTCTRDIYANETALTPEQAKQIATGIANAMQHLHGQGLLHGDLYAHNILWNDQHVVLCDLGGASFLPLQDKALTQQLIQLDKRAYQILVDELKLLIKE